MRGRFKKSDLIKVDDQRPRPLNLNMGDVVFLASGSPPLTVIHVDRYGDVFLRVTDGGFMKFHTSMLRQQR